MSSHKPSWWKPGISGTGSACGCCGGSSDILHLDTKLYTGAAGGYTGYKKGKVWFSEPPDLGYDGAHTLGDIEKIIQPTDENEYVIKFHSVMRYAEYQRHARNNWVLISTEEDPES